VIRLVSLSLAGDTLVYLHFSEFRIHLQVSLTFVLVHHHIRCVSPLASNLVLRILNDPLEYLHIITLQPDSRNSNCWCGPTVRSLNLFVRFIFVPDISLIINQHLKDLGFSGQKHLFLFFRSSNPSGS